MTFTTDPDATHGHESEPAARTIDQYRLLHRIGEGGMGEVWLARQQYPIRREVALKIIKAGMDTAQVVARFEAERQALALMAHPAIAQVFDAGATPQGRPYFVMEYVAGEPITVYCNRHRLSMETRIELFLQVCEAVHHAHQKGIIHRDLKPSNILVTVVNARAVAKIIDFGVAKATAQPLTQRTLFTELGVLVGTPEYMSPEQAEMTGLDVDTRTDVYALGVTLYELVTGALPFEGKTLRAKGLDEIRRIIRDTDPPRPSTRVTRLGADAAIVAHERQTNPTRLASQLRGDLDWITMKALEKDRTRRYGSASDFAADLQRHLDDLPVVAGPPSAAYLATKFVRRHRFGVLTGAAALVLLIGFTVALSVQARRLARERDRAEEVSAFLGGLFEASDPDRTKGATLTARDLIDTGVRRLNTELKDEPETRAALGTLIGRTYRQLGQFDVAARVLEDALAVRRQWPGAGSLDLATTLNELGSVYLSKGDLAKAEGLYREALKIRTSQLGRDHPETAKTIHNLAGIAWQHGRLDEAERLYREAASILTVRGGSDGIRPLINLGSVLSREDKDAEAIQVLRESVTLATKTLGRENSLTLAAMNNLGYTLEKTEELEEAERVHREVLEIRRKVLGDSHFDVGLARYNLGNTLAALGRVEEAAQMLRASVTTLRAALAGPHLQLGWALTDLGSVEFELGHLDDAERLHKEAIAIFTTIQGDPTAVGKPWYGLGEVFYERGQLSDAEKYFRMDLDLLRKYPSTPPTILAWPESALGRVWIEQGKPAEAEPLLRHAVQSLRAELPQGHWRTASAEVMLGACLTAQRQFEDAEPLLLNGFAVLNVKQGAARRETQYARTRIVALYDAWKKPAQADSWRTAARRINARGAS